MKEATGEANMTVITIILIALVLAIGTPIITNLISGVSQKADCNNNGSYWYDGQCNATPKKQCQEQCGGGTCWNVCS